MSESAEVWPLAKLRPFRAINKEVQNIHREQVTCYTFGVAGEIYGTRWSDLLLITVCLDRASFHIWMSESVEA